MEEVRKLRTCTLSQLSKITGDSENNLHKKLARRKVPYFNHEGRNVYSFDRPKFVDHELLVSDLHCFLWPDLISWEQPYRSSVNPDARYETSHGVFHLEMETGTSSIPKLVDKCWEYLGTKGRVHFDLPSEKEAKKLCDAILASGIRHFGKFWVSWRGNEALSPNGLTYILRPSLVRELFL